MRKVLRILFIILAVIMGLSGIVIMIGGDSPFQALILCIAFFIISNLFKDKKQVVVSNNMNSIVTSSVMVDDSTIMVINEIYTIVGEGTVVCGEILKEHIEPYTYAIVKTKNNGVLETQIMNFREKIDGVNRAIDVAYKGNYISVGLRGISKEQISVGDIICYKN